MDDVFRGLVLECGQLPASKRSAMTAQCMTLIFLPKEASFCLTEKHSELPAQYLKSSAIEEGSATFESAVRRALYNSSIPKKGEQIGAVNQYIAASRAQYIDQQMNMKTKNQRN